MISWISISWTLRLLKRCCEHWNSFMLWARSMISALRVWKNSSFKRTNFLSQNNLLQLVMTQRGTHKIGTADGGIPAGSNDEQSLAREWQVREMEILCTSSPFVSNYFADLTCLLGMETGTRSRKRSLRSAPCSAQLGRFTIDRSKRRFWRIRPMQISIEGMLVITLPSWTSIIRGLSRTFRGNGAMKTLCRFALHQSPFLECKNSLFSPWTLVPGAIFEAVSGCTRSAREINAACWSWTHFESVGHWEH